MNSNINRKGLLQYLGLPHHEYWSWWCFVIPVWPLWIWYMIRTGRITWFTAVSPGLEDSGFMGESKIRILNSIPEQYIPRTIFFEFRQAFDAEKVKLEFPLIAKPDIGGKGRKIEIVNNLEELHNYHLKVGENYMIQEIIPYTTEFGIFYARLPFEEKGKVISVAEKGFLKVKGNGTASIRELMQKDYRASLQISRLESTVDLSAVLPEGKEMLLEPIGNHSRGTMFINRNDMINDKLSDVIDHISKQIDGFYYGRYDIRVSSTEDLYLGKNIYILELNGLTSDATHIFDPQYKLRDVFKTQFKHCNIAFQIARYNLKHGASTTPFRVLYRKIVENF